MQKLFSNKKTTGLVVFGTLFISLISNIALAQRVFLLQSSNNVDTIAELEDEKFELQKQIVASNEAISKQEQTILSLTAQIEEERPEANAGIVIDTSRSNQGETAPQLEAVTTEKKVPVNVEATNFVLNGDCDYSFSTAIGVPDRVCSIIDAGSQEVYVDIINCKEGSYFDQRGIDGQLCSQGAGVTLGKKLTDGIYFSNITSQDGVIVMMDIYQYTFNTGNFTSVEKLFTFARQSEDFPQNTELDSYTKSFSDAYRKYINDSIPESLSSKYYTN